MSMSFARHGVLRSAYPEDIMSTPCLFTILPARRHISFLSLEQCYPHPHTGDSFACYACRSLRLVVSDQRSSVAICNFVGNRKFKLSQCGSIVDHTTHFAKISAVMLDVASSRNRNTLSLKHPWTHKYRSSKCRTLPTPHTLTLAWASISIMADVQLAGAVRLDTAASFPSESSECGTSSSEALRLSSTQSHCG